MNWKWALAGAVTTLVMGPWSLGMAGDRPVFRAQGGVVYPESYPYHGGMIYGDMDECEDDHCGPFTRCWTYITTLGGRPGAGFYGGGAGTNQYLYRYQAPKNLVYPPANQPAGVVVYPYYTVKGPDDFFMN